MLTLRQRADQRMTDGICDGLQPSRALNRVIYDQEVGLILLPGDDWCVYGCDHWLPPFVGGLALR